MEIIIYPNIKKPTNKKEKDHYAQLVNEENSKQVVEINTSDDIINSVTKYAWNPSVYSGRRLKKNYLHSDFLAFDIDSGLSILEAEKIVHKLNLVCICLPSVSHTPKHNKFRLIFPLEQRIDTLEDYEYNWKILGENFNADPNTKDALRFYYQSSLEDGFYYQEGKLYSPQFTPKKTKKLFDTTFSPLDESKLNDLQKGLIEKCNSPSEVVLENVPNIVNEFIETAHTGLPGAWWNTCNNFCYALSAMGLDFDFIYHVVSKVAPNPLDSRDERCIEIAVNDGKRFHVEDDL